MLQSGMLIPVHERSETFLFDRILTDIGDNQSIEIIKYLQLPIKKHELLFEKMQFKNVVPN